MSGRRAGEFVWTDEHVERARKQWLAGETSAAIGRSFGLTKNTIVGIARRHGFPKRPSPIYVGPPKVKAPRVVRPKKIADPPVVKVPKPAVIKAEPPKAVVVAKPVVTHTGRVSKCAFLKGTRRNYIACDEPTVPGKSYCDDHCRECFVGWDSRHQHDSELTAAA